MFIRARTVFILVVLLLLAAFAALNWPAFTAPTPLNLLLLQVEAPLGVIMLAIVAVLTILYGLLVMGIETAALLETRRHTRELEAQRQLAEEAESSRLAELRRYLETELGRLHTLPGEVTKPLVARLAQSEEAIRADIERTGNTLAAYIGELEDRLARGGQPPPTS